MDAFFFLSRAALLESSRCQRGMIEGYDRKDRLWLLTPRRMQNARHTAETAAKCYFAAVHARVFNRLALLKVLLESHNQTQPNV